MPPKRGVKSTSRKNTPVSPAKSASSAGAGNPKQTRRSARGAQNDEAESGSVELSLQPIVEANEEDSIEVAGEAAASSSSSSEYSSDTVLKLNTLDYDDIVEFLSDLYQQSSNFIRFFTNNTPDDLIALSIDLQDPASKSMRRLSQRLAIYLPTRGSFGDDIFIDSQIIVRKLQDGVGWADVVDGIWRPDALLYLANLAQLLATAFVTIDDQMDDFFRDIHNNHLHLFGSTEYLNRFSSSRVQEAVEFANAVRTQHFIRHARQNVKRAGFDPDDGLNELFYEGNDIRGINIYGPDFKATMENRVLEIRKFVTTNSKNPVKIEQLERAFPWTDFLLQLVQWALVRSQELENQIAAQGGVDNIIEHIRTKNFTPLANGAAEAATAQAALDQALPIDPQLTQGTAPTRKGRPPKKPSGVALQQQIAQMKNMQAAMAAQDPTGAGKAATPRRGRKHQEVAEYDAEQHAVAEPDVPYGPADSIAESELLRPSQTTNLVERTLAAHAKESSKENQGVLRQRSFLDPQDNARKVLFNITSSEKRRRGQEDADVDDDDDDEFEQDVRPTKQARRSKGKGGASIEQGQSSTQPPPQPRSTLRPMSSQPPPPSSAPAAFHNIDEEEYEDHASRAAAVNARAKEYAQERRQANLSSSPQVRRAWSSEEVNRLMDLIKANDGPKYSKILQDDRNAEFYPNGPVLQERSQVQLKDKARNLKMDCLKARARLPDGFVQVSIGKRMVEILRHSHGITYIDGDGRADGLGGDEV